MRHLLLGAVALLGLATQAHSAPIPATNAPTAYDYNSNYAEGVTDSVGGLRLSPFAGTSADGRPYDVVYGNDSDDFGFGTGGISALYSPTQFFGSNGEAGVFKFLDGSPDDYNYLVFFNSTTNTITKLSGGQIAPVTGSGFQVVTLTGLGAYDTVGFGSLNQNAFEYAALSAVPLPASAPLFGAALLGLAGLGYGLKRKTAAAA